MSMAAGIDYGNLPAGGAVGSLLEGATALASVVGAGIAGLVSPTFAVAAESVALVSADFFLLKRPLRLFLSESIALGAVREELDA